MKTCQSTRPSESANMLDHLAGVKQLRVEKLVSKRWAADTSVRILTV
jgi:hypothetical protein